MGQLAFLVLRYLTFSGVKNCVGLVNLLGQIHGNEQKELNLSWTNLQESKSFKIMWLQESHRSVSLGNLMNKIDGDKLKKLDLTETKLMFSSVTADFM